MSTPGTVLHVAPHPDDEVIGAPATLLALRSAGWRVLDVVASVGRPEHADVRRREAEEAASRAGFELVVPDPPVAISRDDDLDAAQRRLAVFLRDLLAGPDAPVIVVSPSPHDGHPGHEVVARAVRDALEREPAGQAWWMWGLWADLPLPTLYVAFDEARLAAALHLLDAYPSQTARNDYRRLVPARAAANAVLGSEWVFGFGAPAASDAPYAELLTELVCDRGRWWAGTSRVLDPAAPLRAPTTHDLSWWLDERSVRDRWRRDRPAG